MPLLHCEYSTASALPKRQMKRQLFEKFKWNCQVILDYTQSIFTQKLHKATPKNV